MGLEQNKEVTMPCMLEDETHTSTTPLTAMTGNDMKDDSASPELDDNHALMPEPRDGDGFTLPMEMEHQNSSASLVRISKQGKEDDIAASEEEESQVPTASPAIATEQVSEDGVSHATQCGHPDSTALITTTTELNCMEDFALPKLDSPQTRNAMAVTTMEQCKEVDKQDEPVVETSTAPTTTTIQHDTQDELQTTTTSVAIVELGKGDDNAIATQVNPQASVSLPPELPTDRCKVDCISPASSKPPMVPRDQGKEEIASSVPAFKEAAAEGPFPEAIKNASQTTPTSCSSTASCANRPIRHQRSSSFQKWKHQVQRAWKWGGATNNSDQGFHATVHLEVMANQKRQWYQVHSQTQDRKLTGPTALFEHFFIVGLHPQANVETSEEAFARRKIYEAEMENSNSKDVQSSHLCGHSPMLDPQILFKYPPGKKLAMTEKDLPAFCFPECVKARYVQRTPSMSDLNEVIYGQDSENATLYGVCLYVQEIVQRAPSILGVISPPARSSSKANNFLVSAPRCYCILTRVPFFELHYEILNSIIAQERLDRITHFVSEMVLSDDACTGFRVHDHINESFDCPDKGPLTNFMDSVVAVNNCIGSAEASTSVASDFEAYSSSFRSFESESSESISCCEAVESSIHKGLERKSTQCSDEFALECSESYFDNFERVISIYEDGHSSPTNVSTNDRLEQIGSLESIYSSARSMGSDMDGEELNIRHENSAGDEKVLQWAKENNNESLQIISAYHSLPLPEHGSEIVFHPLEHLPPIRYFRPEMSSLGLIGGYSNPEVSHSSEANKVDAKLAAAEEALALSLWSVATVCRVLSLENVLSLFSGALLEKQLIVMCSNLGILSATVLSVIPMIRPFEWHSLLLPVLPRKMIDFLDAPVPFIVGIQRKPVDLKLKTANTVQVDIQKDYVRSCSMPQLPRYRELHSELSQIHAKLSWQNPIAEKQPVYKCNEEQAEAAKQFLDVLQHYVESLCTDLRSHSITSVQSNSDKVSLLLKDSYIDSFPAKDRSFIRLLVDTQLFTVLTDSRLSSYNT